MTKIASVECQIVDNTSSKAKSVIWKDFAVLKDCEDNVVRGFAASKKFHKVFAFDSCKQENTLTAAGAQALHQLRTSE